MILNDPYHQFHCRAILWCWVSQKPYDTQTQFQWKCTEIHTPYSTVSFRMTLSDLAKYPVTRSVARSVCDSWASCLHGSEVHVGTGMDLLTGTVCWPMAIVGGNRPVWLALLAKYIWHGMENGQTETWTVGQTRWKHNAHASGYATET